MGLPPVRISYSRPGLAGCRAVKACQAALQLVCEVWLDIGEARLPVQAAVMHQSAWLKGGLLG